MTVAHRFAHGHRIGREAQPLMAPEMAADPAKARLHLIRDQDAAVSAHHRRGTIHEAGGKVGKPFVHEGLAQDHGADADPASSSDRQAASTASAKAAAWPGRFSGRDRCPRARRAR